MTRTPHRDRGKHKRRNIDRDREPANEIDIVGCEWRRRGPVEVRRLEAAEDRHLLEPQSQQTVVLLRVACGGTDRSA